VFDPMKPRFAGGSMGHFDLFLQNKDSFFRPAGGGISCRVNDRVRCVIHEHVYLRVTCS
jgi:hypothetical protein